MNLEKQTCELTPFASRSVLEHLARGVIGAGALGYGLYVSATHAWAIIPLGLVALAAFRGCPMCWTIGLLDTLSRARNRG
jgi:hypothetical protein